MARAYLGLGLLLILTITLTRLVEVDCGSKSGTVFRSTILLEKLLSDYGPPSIRPVRDETTITTVNIRFLVWEIITLDEKDQTLSLSGNLKWIWFDEKLKWNRRQNPGVTKLVVSTDKIWMPDISLHTKHKAIPSRYNNKKTFREMNKQLLQLSIDSLLCDPDSVDVGFERVKSKEAIVYPNGEVFYSTPAIFTFTCKINARIFPFDWQVCNMIFSSWNYHGEELDILPINGSDSCQNQFNQNGVWQLEKVHIQRIVNYYYTGPFPELVFSLYLKRQPVFHVLNLLLPCLLLSILNIAVYMLPPEAGEKIGLGMTNLLALVLFQTLVSQVLPPSSANLPIISYYFTPMIGMSCISIINAVLVLKLFYYGRQCHPIPRWVRSVFGRCLAPMIFYEMIPYEDDLGKTTAETSEPENVEENDENGIDEKMGKEKKSVKPPRYGDFTMVYYDFTTDDKVIDPAILVSHRAIDWQNVALIWDKFIMIVMTLMTGVSLACVTFLYVAGVIQNDENIDDVAGMEVESDQE